jgi:hypothetical protein
VLGSAASRAAGTQRGRSDAQEDWVGREEEAVYHIWQAEKVRSSRRGGVWLVGICTDAVRTCGVVAYSHRAQGSKQQVVLRIVQIQL